MSESERPKPQYGEYASEEELAEALRRSGVDPERADAPVPHAEGDSQGTSRSVTSRPSTPRPNAPGLGTPHPRTARTRGAFDRIATVFLLSFGLVYILGGASNFLNFNEKLPETVQQIGMGEYHSTSLTGGIGIAMLASQLTLWVIAAVWSYRRMKKLKLAWWVPALAAVISFVILTVMLGLLLAADPTLIANLSKPQP